MRRTAAILHVLPLFFKPPKYAASGQLGLVGAVG
jgi:hypothetical protein